MLRFNWRRSCGRSPQKGLRKNLWVNSGEIGALLGDAVPQALWHLSLLYLPAGRSVQVRGEAESRTKNDP